ncbi:MAG TPA: adenylate/guanylate cyclase domain-containing protein [Gaiellaceae bacterium]|nr:adenylate/guanylate cyclase domain-containing protein [Gaiellaceae bacterium]
MVTCPACGQENPDSSRFCGMCGAALAPAAGSAREERKVVTILFTDLVGSTARAEGLDPEDVRATLSAYYAQLRAELERHGGTVEKFIGDAVMALFGAPVAHEDDPERAVRAALAIRDWVRDEQDLQVRIAVNTGEALVSLGARPAEGEGMAAGDVVNTAARLQSAAPVNGILVGERTYRATRHAIDYRVAEPVEAKGKEEPLLVWEAVEARARVGVDVPHEARAELVGRERELDVLRGALARVREERSAQLVTLVGVPGIGKSRLLFELSRLVEAEPELIFWRQGRSLPYGEGISLWALAEIVKAQAGILETDDAEATRAKLEGMVAGLVPGPDGDWVRGHLAALVGLEGAESSVEGGRRREAFAAWRRFFEALAEQRLLVAVFEDLHWADDGVLEFVDHLVDWASGVPVLVLATARPELLERRPDWGGGKPNATTLSLSPLTDEDAARLIGSLRGRQLLDAAEQARILQRVGGNPLYAEQFAQMLEERGAGDELPESIHGIVGARLDALLPEEKQLLQDAAVVGKVFWPGAVAAVGDNGDLFELEERLHALERKQFVRRDRRSSVAGETQYAFLHLLLRDVAYSQIPRAARVDKHAHAAAWVEALGGAEEHAEMLAHHYLSALELARAAGQPTDELAQPARAALAEAGERALALTAYAAAERFFRTALELWPEGAREQRAELLFRLALTLFYADAEGRGESLEQARAEALALGDHGRAAEIDSLMAQLAWMQGDTDRCFERLGEADELVRDAPPSPAKARVLSQVARFRSLAGENALETAREALALAEQLELDEIRAHALVTIAGERFRAGDEGGREDVEEGLRLALAGNYLPVAIRAYSGLATDADHRGDLPACEAFLAEAEQIAARIGGGASLRWVRGNSISIAYELGDWSRCAAAADEFLAESAESPHYHDGQVRATRALIRLARGDVDGALADAAGAVRVAREIKDPQALFPALAISASVLTEAGRIEEANRVVDEIVAAGERAYLYCLEELVWSVDPLGRSGEVLAALEPAHETVRRGALRKVLCGELEEAALQFEAMGALRSAALARLRLAERLADAGRRAEADLQLQQALGFFRSVGAKRYVERGERLLAASA